MVFRQILGKKLSLFRLIIQRLNLYGGTPKSRWEDAKSRWGDANSNNLVLIEGHLSLKIKIYSPPKIYQEFSGGANILQQEILASDKIC